MDSDERLTALIDFIVNIWRKNIAEPEANYVTQLTFKLGMKIVLLEDVLMQHEDQTFVKVMTGNIS